MKRKGPILLSHLWVEKVTILVDPMRPYKDFHFKHWEGIRFMLYKIFGIRAL